MPYPKVVSATQMKVPDWLFVAIPSGAKAHGSKSFNPFTELGSMLALRKDKGMSKAVQTNSRTQNYDLYQNTQHYFYVYSA